MYCLSYECVCAQCKLIYTLYWGIHQLQSHTLFVVSTNHISVTRVFSCMVLHTHIPVSRLKIELILLACMVCMKLHCKFRMQPYYNREMIWSRWYISFDVIHLWPLLSVLRAGHLVCVELWKRKKGIRQGRHRNSSDLSSDSFRNVLKLFAWFIRHLGLFTLQWIWNITRGASPLGAGACLLHTLVALSDTSQITSCNGWEKVSPCCLPLLSMGPAGQFNQIISNRGLWFNQVSSWKH